MRLVLLPGMDGTGELFRDFVAALPEGYETEVVRYPTDAGSSYAELMPLVLAHLPTEETYVLLAESFSTPLAIAIAAKNAPNLKALVLCGGFATSPVKGWLYDLTSLLPLRRLHVRFPEFVARTFLVGSDAPASLARRVGAEISWVEPEVLAARVRAVLSCDVRAEFAEVRVPIQYLRAAEDKLVSLDCLEEMLAFHPQMVVATIDGPHLLLQREPEFTAGVVAGFVMGLGLGSEAG